MYYSLILFTLIVALLIYFVWDSIKYIKIWWKIGGPYPIPLSIPLYLILNFKSILYNLSDISKKYGNFWFTWTGPVPMVYTSDPEVAQIILTSNKCLTKSVHYKVFTDAVGLGILTLEHNEWLKARKLINPAFRREILLTFVPIFNEKIDIFVDILNEYDGEEVPDLIKLISRCTFDIGNRTTMGTELNIQRNSDSNYYNAIIEMMDDAMERAIKFWLLNDFIFKMTQLSKSIEKNRKVVHDWIQSVITNKIKLNNINTKTTSNDTTNTTANDDDVNIIKSKNIFIDNAYIQVQQNLFNWDDFESHSKHILSAAFETGANTLCAIISFLAMHQDYQEKLFIEIVKNLPEKNSYVTYEQIQQMPYLDMIINESSRLYPAVPIIGREVTEDMEIKNVIISKGTQLVVDIFNLHRNHQYWGPNSSKFNPENFSAKNLTNRHPSAFIPFAKGIRNCIGAKYATILLRIFISKVIRNYKITTDFNYENLEYVPLTTLKFKVNPKIKVFRREK